MAQISASGIVEQRFRGSSGFVLPLGFMGPAILLLLATSWLQGQSAPNSTSTQKNTATTSSASPVTQEVGPTPVAPEPPPPTAEQKPPQPPAVAWDGKLLTIDADNSRLADILVAVRDQTGASIEIPPTASSERVFVHLGPGPARDILSDLLYGTQFDYMVEAADDDPDTLRKVVLTARGQGDGSGDVVVAGATNNGEGIGGASPALAATAHRGGVTDGRSRQDGVRMMPGWAGPGKPAFQAEAEAALAAEQAAAQDAAAAKDSAAAQDAAAAAQDVAAAQNSAGAQDSAVAAETSEATKASNSSPSTSDTASDSNDASGVGQAIQNMNRMFEQRRQIQAKQNQAPPPSSN